MSRSVSSSSESAIVPILYAIFFVSGAAALIYQIAWVRSLSLVFGGSHLAVATVVAIFMAGLALGGYLAAKKLPRQSNRLRLYALLELGIAGGALLFEIIRPAYPIAYVALAGLAPESPTYLTLVRVCFSVLVLLPMTTLMGATLPVLVDFCTARPTLIGRRLSALYAVNTAGAVSGVLLAGFVLLPNTSIGITVASAFAANLLAAAGAWLLARQSGAAGASSAHRGNDELRQTRAPGINNPSRASLTAIEDATAGNGWGHLENDGLARFILWGAAISGCCALAYEILWTRVLVIGLGATDYGFTAILTAFLIGIGGGSTLYNWLPQTRRDADDRRRLFRAFALAQLTIGALVAFAATRLYDLPALFISWRETFESTGLPPFHARQAANLALAMVYLGPPAFIMGLAFPLAGELLGPYSRSPADAVGRVAALNTLGAIVGSLLAGFVLIGSIGIERSIQLFVIGNLAFGLALWLRVSARPRAWRVAPALAVAIGAVLLLVPALWRAWDPNFFAVYRSNRPELFASNAKIAEAIGRYKVLYYGEGASSIVAASEADGVRIFSTNGRVEATSGLQDMQNQYALGHLPTLLHADPQDVLVVGGGAGMTLGATSVHSAVRHVTLAELEPKVLGVIKAFKEFNHDVLANPALRVVINDGRNHLLTTRERYDVITSDPIHPWFRGAGYLYTREYFELAAQRLKPGGVMAQWLPLYQMTPAHIRSVLASFSGAFKHVAIWLLYSDALIVGSNTPLVADLERIDGAIRSSPPLAADLSRVLLGGRAENLMTYFVAGNNGVARLVDGARINTDDNLYLEFDTPRAITLLTEPDNIALLSSVRESALPLIRSRDPERIATWRNFEATGISQRIDRLQHAAQARLHTRPEDQKLAGELDAAAGRLGRWETVRAHFAPASPRP